MKLSCVSIRLLALLAFLGAASSASAYTVQPMVMEIGSVGGKNNSQFIISNKDSNEPLPISVTPLRVNLMEDGSVEEVSAVGEILVFPPTAIVPAGQEQVIRVQYLGDPDMKTAQAYRVQIENLPVELDKDKAGVQVRTEFRALMFVVPPGASANPSVVSISERGSDGYITVRVDNTGNHYVTLSGGGLKLYNQNNDVLEMKSDEVTRNVRGSIIFPLAERDVKIAVPSEFGSVKRIELLGF